MAESPSVNKSEVPIQIGKNLEELLKYSILPLEIFSKIIVGDHQYSKIYKGVVIFKFLNRFSDSHYKRLYVTSLAIIILT